MTYVSIGSSAAGKRIHEAGKKYQNYLASKASYEARRKAVQAALDVERKAAREVALEAERVAAVERVQGPVRQIIAEVAAANGLRPQDITGRRQAREITYPRQEAMYRAMMETNLTYPVVARIFWKDHSTIIHGVRAHAARNNLPPIPGQPGRKRTRNITKETTNG